MNTVRRSVAIIALTEPRVCVECSASVSPHFVKREIRYRRYGVVYSRMACELNFERELDDALETDGNAATIEGNSNGLSAFPDNRATTAQRG